MTAIKFKVGDKVKVKKDLIVPNIYGEIGFISDMEKWCGTIQTIKEIRGSHYILNCSRWSWTDEMLESVDGKKEKPLTKKQIEENLVTSFVKQYEERTKIIDNEMKINESTLKDYSRAIVNYQQTRIRLQNEKENAKKFVANSKKTLITRINEIKTLPIVEKVELIPEGIKVDYKGIIKMKYNAKVSYPLGKFYILIEPNGVKIRNETPFEDKINGVIYHTPHVDDSGICFGTYHDKVYELLGNMKYKELILLLYLFLKSYNHTDCYITIGKLIKIRKGLDPDMPDGNDDDNDNDGEDD